MLKVKLSTAAPNPKNLFEALVDISYKTRLKMEIEKGDQIYDRWQRHPNWMESLQKAGRLDYSINNPSLRERNRQKELNIQHAKEKGLSDSAINQILGSGNAYL